MGTAQKGSQGQAIGKSKGGWTTKILALTDDLPWKKWSTLIERIRLIQTLIE
jgi:hypothetical protein